MRSLPRAKSRGIPPGVHKAIKKDFLTMLETEARRLPTAILFPDSNTRFREVFSRFEQENLDYRVVGSMAIAAHLGESTNLRVRDIDVICFATSAEVVRVLQSEFDEAYTKSNGRLLRVDLSTAIFREDGKSVERVTHPVTLPKLLVNIGKDNGGYCISYNGLKEPINKEIMQPVQLPFAQTTITTIPPETLLHLYIARGGSLKPKDMPKLRSLARFCRDHPTEGLTHTDFEVFHRFAARMREDYPWQTSLYRFLAKLDYISRGKISKNFLVA